MNLLSVLALSAVLAVSVEPIRKKAGDKRLYQGLVLPNQLKVVLVQDPAAVHAAASLTVSSGSQDDPDAFPGMAHFCEHMLFLGSTKYPGEDMYQQYFSANGGSTSASTGYNHTNYNFRVDPSALDTGLDMFASTFVAPLFDRHGVLREVNAVQSEYEFRSKNLFLKTQAVTLAVANTSHPYTRFKCGSYQTLVVGAELRGQQLHALVQQHHAKYYSANLMNLVVVSPFSLERMHGMVVPRFGQIPNHNIAATNAGSPFLPQHLASDIAMDPKVESTKLVLEFILPHQGYAAQKNVFEYIEHYLGRDDAGSLQASVKKKGNVDSVSAGFVEAFTDFAIFHISFYLTSLSPEIADDLTRDAFAYLQALRDQGITQERYAEFLDVYKRRAKMQGELSASNLAYLLSGNLHDGMPIGDVVTGMDYSEAFDATAIWAAVQLFTPAAMRRLLVKPGTATTQHEPWFDSDYAVSPIGEDRLADFNHPPRGFPFPAVKPYAPPKQASQDSPKTITLAHTSDDMRLWHVGGPQESELKMLSLAMVDLQNQPTDPETARLALLANYLQEYVVEAVDLSEDEDVEFSPSNNKLAVRIRAFDAHRALASILEAIKGTAIARDGFEKEKAKYIKFVDRFDTKDPLSQAMLLAMAATSWDSMANQALKKELEGLTHESFVAWFKSFLSCNRIDALLVGHEDSAPIAALLQTFQEGDRVCSALPQQPTEILLAGDSVYERRLAGQGQVNSAIAFFLDLYSTADTEKAACTLLVASLLQQDFFNQLRTVEQLGYVVSAYHFAKAGGGGLMMNIQSTHSPAYLEARIEAFLLHFLQKLESMPEDTFRNKQQALVRSRVVKQPSIRQVFHEYWPSILDGDADFQRDDATTALLKTITQPQLVQFMRAHLVKASPLRKKLSVHVALPTATSDLAACGTPITDLDTWKKPFFSSE